MNKQPIIVFDSGIGGMSIYRPLKLSLPKENIIYIADSVNFPYGDKSELWLKERFIVLLDQFRDLSPKLVVLACNTATTNIIFYLRDNLSCPVVGVEPVIKPLSQYDHSLVLMTASSSTSVSTKQLLQKYGQNVEIFTPQGLAVAIEYHDLGQVKKNIHEIKEIAQSHKIKAIGLSCTHYPLILGMLKSAMPEVIFIEPAEAVVKEVSRVLNLDQV